MDKKIEEVRSRLDALRNDKPTPVDAQSTFISVLTFGLIEPGHVRIALVALFALMGRNGRHARTIRGALALL
jgi:hypothetical protein